jgi:hypothetical protein
MVKRKKARKAAAKRSAKTGRIPKAKAGPRAKARKAKPAKRPSGPIKSAISAIEETAALRERLAGRNTFED